MNRRSLNSNWTEEDRRTCAKWRLGIAVFYGCMALLVFGVIALTKSSNVASNEAGDRQISSHALRNDPHNPDALSRAR